MRLVITPDGVADDEDWRFFAPCSDGPHFVIEGGKIDPDSLPTSGASDEKKAVVEAMVRELR